MMKKSLLLLILILGFGSLIQAQTVLTGYTENFNHKLGTVDSAFWSPNPTIFSGDTLVFTVKQDRVSGTDSALHVMERQSSFADGQMYTFLTTKNVLLDLSQNPYLSFRMKIDSADWRAPDWGQGGKAVPQTTVPVQISPWSGGNRLVNYSFNMPIDGQWHEYFFTFVTNPQVDLSAIDEILLESVTWNLGSENVHNKCYYWLDDFKAGDEATITAVTDVAITGAADITTNGTALNLGVTITPADATFTGVLWQAIRGTGYGTIDATGKFTPIADGSMKVVALARDGSGLTDTVTINMTNQTDTVKTYTQTFNSAPDMNIWSPASGQVYSGDTMVFNVTWENNALHVKEIQKDFFDGQMYMFKQTAGKLLNLNDNPFISFNLKVDSADWRAPDWSQGGKAVPQATVPFGISPWDDAHADRLGQALFQVAPDGQWHTYYCTFVTDPATDLSAVSKILFESVTWNLGSENVHNKVYYWLDDFKMGTAAKPPSQATEFTVTGKDGVDSITTNGTKLQMVGNFTPADATLQDVIWKLIPGTAYGTLDASGLLTPISDGQLKVVGLTKDGSNLSDTAIITLLNQYDTVKTYTQTFNTAPDMNVWAPNGMLYGGDTLVFTITAENSALHIKEIQKDFFDGQMLEIKGRLGKIFNLNDKPFMSFRVMIDSADWRAPDWGQGGKAVPQTSVPFGASVWDDAHTDRLAGYVRNVPIDQAWHTLYYSFITAPQLDLKGIDQVLIESVTWNLGTENVHNKVYYWFDDFKVGSAVTVPYLVENILVKGAGGKDSIKTKAGKLKLSATVTPDTATFMDVNWTVSDTSLASVDNTGLVQAKADGVVTVTAAAIDGSAITGTMDVKIINQELGIPKNRVTGFSLYPNPATDYLRISNADKISRVSVISVTGQVMINENFSGKSGVDISSLNRGVYFVKIEDRDGNTIIRKVIKQ